MSNVTLNGLDPTDLTDADTIVVGSTAQDEIKRMPANLLASKAELDTTDAQVQQNTSDIAALQNQGGGGFDVDEFIDKLSTSSDLTANKDASGNLVLTIPPKQTGIAKDQLAIDSSMSYTESGWQVGADGKKRLLIVDGATVGNKTKFFWPIHLLTGKAVGWGIDKASESVISPHEWTMTGSFSTVGLGCYLKVEAEGTVLGIRYKKYTEVKPVSGGVWTKSKTGYEDYIIEVTHEAYPPSWDSTMYVGDGLRFEPNTMIRTVLEFVDPVPSDFKLYIKEDTHPQFNRIQLPDRNYSYIPANIGQDF